MVSYSVKIDAVSCRDCGADDVYMDLKEEPSLYNVGAYCHSCDLDYGVIERVSRNNVGHMDESWALAEDSVEQYLE